MAFVCTLTGDSFNAEVARRGSSRVVIARIGIDNENDTIYSLMVCLDAGGGGDMELVFCILAASSSDDEEPREFWSGTETAFIQGDDRERVLSAVIGCVESLIRTVQPPRVYMCTFDTDMPDHALIKHLRVAHAVETCGYDVKMPDPFHGQRFWYMERRQQE